MSKVTSTTTLPQKTEYIGASSTIYYSRSNKVTDMHKLFCGIDPGLSGGISILDSTGNVIVSQKIPEDPKEIVWLLREYPIHFCILEKVHSMPKQGVTSTFTFGTNFGILQGILLALGIPFDFVTPQKWQKEMGCMSKGDKNVTKSMASRLFPKIKVTHAIADSLLIAEYCRRYCDKNILLVK